MIEKCDGQSVVVRGNREFENPWQQRQGQRRLKNELIFYLRILRYNKVILISLFLTVKITSKLFFKQHRIWSFHVAVLERTAKKCTKNCNAHAQPLLCSLDPMFSDVAVAVAVMVFLNSLMLPLRSLL